MKRFYIMVYWFSAYILALLITVTFERDAFKIKVSKLPVFVNGSINTRLMPFVGNGHLASTIFDNSVYLNGVYNGKGGTSHRSRVPNIHNFQFKINKNIFKKRYLMDFYKGVFTEVLEDTDIIIKRNIFAHYHFTRLLITQIELTRKSNDVDLDVLVDFDEDYSSEDFHFEPIRHEAEYKVLIGETLEKEDEIFQNTSTSLVMHFIKPINLTLAKDQKSLRYYVISSIDINETRSKEEIDIALEYIRKGNGHQLFKLHCKAFSSIWLNGRIEVDNFELQKVIYASQYYTLSSLPSINHYGNLNQFYGLSPGTLSRGSKLRDYQAKNILSYRIHTYKAAEYNSKLINKTGLRYSWESAFTGIDVSEDCCPEVLREFHISGDIAFAARQYFSATRDLDWLKNQNGNFLIQGIASFWLSIISYNSSKKKYEILNVLPPDEDAPKFVNNSIYTNTIAALSVYFANYTNCILNETQYNISIKDKINCLYMPYDKNLDLNLDYDSYKYGTIIKQADTILLGYPLLWNMNKKTRLNDLSYYENVTRPDGPAMTWSMHAIGNLEFGNFEKAHKLFDKSFSIYVQDPFKVWTEEENNMGAVNFITGAGGFLQALLFGYGGLRLKVETFEIYGNWTLPLNCTYLKFQNIKYLNTSLSLNYTKDNIILSVGVINSAFPLKIITPNEEFELKENYKFKLKKFDFIYVIKSDQPQTNCSLPYDHIDNLYC